jgi:hypothetical protein
LYGPPGSPLGACLRAWLRASAEPRAVLALAVLGESLLHRFRDCGQREDQGGHRVAAVAGGGEVPLHAAGLTTDRLLVRREVDPRVTAAGDPHLHIGHPDAQVEAVPEGVLYDEFGVQVPEEDRPLGVRSDGLDEASVRELDDIELNHECLLTRVIGTMAPGTRSRAPQRNSENTAPALGSSIPQSAGGILFLFGGPKEKGCVSTPSPWSYM